MEISLKAYLPIFVWIGFGFTLLLFGILYRWAKKRKGAAFAVGLFIQMFLPDPKVQQTINWVAESKEKSGEIKQVGQSDTKD